MPTYVYGCDTDQAHPRKETAHMMSKNPDMVCECGSLMHRVPQPLQAIIYRGVLLDWMCDNDNRIRAGKPVKSPYKVKRPDGIPGKDFHTR